MKLKTYFQFLNESISHNGIKLSRKLINNLESIQYLKLAKFILELRDMNESLLNDYIPDWLDINEKGEFSFLNRRFYEKGMDPWTTSKRQTSKLNKIMIKLFKDNEYYNNNIISKDVEDFTNKWRSLFDTEIKVEQWRGEKLLEAFNYTGLIDMSKFSASCANFKQEEADKLGRCSWDEPKKEWYRIYTENPQNISIIVSLKGGKVTGRRLMVEGEQVENNGDYKKGVYYRFVNGYYGEGGDGSIFDSKIKEYLKQFDNVIIRNVELKTRKVYNGNFIVKVNDTKFKEYPPFDYFYVNFEKNLLSSNYRADFRKAYKTRYP